MQPQVGFLVASIFAQATSKGFLARMNPDMPTIGRFDHNFVAEVTFAVAHRYWNNVVLKQL